MFGINVFFNVEVLTKNKTAQAIGIKETFSNLIIPHDPMLDKSQKATPSSMYKLIIFEATNNIAFLGVSSSSVNSKQIHASVCLTTLWTIQIRFTKYIQLCKQLEKALEDHRYYQETHLSVFFSFFSFVSNPCTPMTASTRSPVISQMK